MSYGINPTVNKKLLAMALKGVEKIVEANNLSCKTVMYRGVMIDGKKVIGSIDFTKYSLLAKDAILRDFGVRVKSWAESTDLWEAEACKTNKSAMVFLDNEQHIAISRRGEEFATLLMCEEILNKIAEGA